MDVAPKPALADSTNALPPPAAKTPPRPAADEPPVVARFVGTNDLPAGAGRAAALAALLQPAPLRPAPPAAPPKESSSAFVFFGLATRDDIKAAHPDWPLGFVGRELSKRWKALDDAAKKPFHELAAADKERYEREKAAYDAANPPPPVVAENVPSAPAPRKKPAKREAPPTKEVPIDEDQDWTPKNDGKQLVSVWTGKPVEPPRAKKQKQEKPAAKPAAKPAKKPAAKPASRPRRSSREAAKLAQLAAREAAAQGDKTYEPARDRFLTTGLDPATKQKGTVPPTKAEMLCKVDKRVAAKKSKAAKGAEWLDRMAVDDSFWAKVNNRCLPQADRKKMGDALAGGAKRGSQKGQAAAKKARKA